MKSKMNDNITLIITTYNWLEVLAKVLRAVKFQTILPKEVIIADDGSSEDTAEYLRQQADKFPIPLIHVWHPDNGFRRTVILNKAIAKASGNYIIQIDGDVIPEKHFIQDHLAMAEKGAFVCGSRVKLKLNGHLEISHAINSIRCRFLRNLLSNRYGKNIGTHMRGCNFAFWREDFISVNGYNEDMTGWGYEDTELAYRFYNKGCKKKVLKFGGIVYHIWHIENTKRNKEKNFALQYKTKDNKSKWCTNGVDKYL